MIQTMPIIVSIPHWVVKASGNHVGTLETDFIGATKILLFSKNTKKKLNSTLTVFVFSYLRNVSVEGDQGKPNIEFTQDGVLKAAELKIMNLRPGVSKQLVWEEVSFNLQYFKLPRLRFYRVILKNFKPHYGINDLIIVVLSNRL